MDPRLKRGLFVVFLVIVLTITITKHFLPQNVKESLTYFPIDPFLSFLIAETNLYVQEKKEKSEYIVKWETISETDKKVYLRQDVSILFRDGRLENFMYKWKENAGTLKQSKSVSGSDSTLYQVITLHHAENHLLDQHIKSAQTITSEKLYIIDSSFSPFASFHVPTKKEHAEWKKILDHIISENQNMSWNQLLAYFQINRSEYYEFSLFDLVLYNSKPFPGLNQEQSQKIIGQLWEGIYKNYLLGIKISQDETISPIGSKTPLILISKDLSFLYILIEGKNGEMIKLIQQL